MAADGGEERRDPDSPYTKNPARESFVRFFGRPLACAEHLLHLPFSLRVPHCPLCLQIGISGPHFVWKSVQRSSMPNY